MSTIVYRLARYLLWNGGKWYVRKRLPPARALAGRALLAGAGLTAMVLAARRVKG
ncbi:MAG TPA: hypothetical protein VNZ01_03510 [Solirubrobacteraceae bacterium]|jgi:hypothetical protein|nr:hypothetical protein [Solirubrobacteraceae bacterium]